MMQPYFMSLKINPSELQNTLGIVCQVLKWEVKFIWGGGICHSNEYEKVSHLL